MALNAKFQVNAARQLLSPETELCAMYIGGADRPSWDALAQWTREGGRLVVLSRGPAAPEIAAAAAGSPDIVVVQLSETHIHFSDLSQLSWPIHCNLLLIDDYAIQRDLLRDTLSAGAQPAVIVCRDGSQDLIGRQAKYALLTQMGYHFAGLSGEYSLWTRARRHMEIGAPRMTELPTEIRSLPLGTGATVQIDETVGQPGEIAKIHARSALSISGWATISANQALAEHLFACTRHEETGVEEFMRLPREARRDVANHFQNPQLLMAGFRADLSPLVHRVGIHSVSILQADRAHRYESGTLFRFAIESQPYELSARAGLANRYIRGNGIEIGALQKPAKLSSDCQVRYIDRMSLQKLLEHYPEMATIPVQAPDIVDDGQLLTHIAEDSQDFAIANHFLEHCPDPIRSLHNMLRVVKQGGILFLAVPDKRHTFDLRRPVTPYAALRAAYLSGHRSGRSELFFEWAHLVYNLPQDEAKVRAEQLMDEDYSIHYNVWATGDLLNFLMQTRHDFQSPFEVAAVVSSENETIVLLERTGGRLPI